MVKNSLLRKSLRRFSHSEVKRQHWFKTHSMKPLAKYPKVEKKKKVAAMLKYKNKEGKEVLIKKIPFPTQRNAKPINTRSIRLHRNFHSKKENLRKSLVPGTILIMLAGRFRGRRVVYLKQLPSGLLLITGPFKINGIPLRRISSSYVIATSTKISLKGVKIDEKVINDSIFLRSHDHRRTKSEREFFKSEPDKKKTKLDWEIKKHEVTAPRKQAQKEIDTVILAEIKKVPLLKDYLSARFSLSNNQYPHLMKF
jgi:large subunit ribosomal protein L6e